MFMNNITLKEAAKLFVGKRNVRLLCHIRPDGDTLGSAFGLKYALEITGRHKVNVVCEDEVPRRLMFLTGDESNLLPDSPTEPDLTVSIDCAETHRIGKSYEGTVDLKLDHHKDGGEYAIKNYTEEDSAATGEIIYLLIRELEKLGEGMLTKEAATSLYAAISSDTGSFKYSNVTSRTLRIAADLVEAGAENAVVSHYLFGIKTLGEIAAQEIMLNNFELYLGGRVAFLLITNDMKRGFPDDNFSDVVSQLREIEGVELSVTVRQEAYGEGGYRISMRSAETVSSSELCKLLGGGGHERAAGATIEADSPEEAKRKVLDTVLAALK